MTNTYVGGGTYPGAYGYGREDGCDHSELTHVLTIGKAKIWAGSRVQAEAEYGWKLMICLLGHPTASPAPVRLNKNAKALMPESLTEWEPPAIMSVDWTDGSTPPMGRQWWLDLYKALGEIDGDVVFYCFGGHGRTGTAISILAGLGGLVKHGCPVRYVRKHYCNKAVETTSQIEYVERMTEKKVHAESAYMIKQKREEKEKAKLPTVTTYPPATQGALGSADGGPNKTFVYDKGSGSLIQKGDPNAEQDWEKSWHSHTGMY